MAQLSDISLVAQVAVFHNKRAFDQLVRKYQSPVRRFFLAQTLGDTQLSDDLAQDTFIKAYTRIASFKGMAGFQTWLMRIAYNVLYDYRTCITMQLIDGLPIDEIADIMQLPQGTVKSHLSRGKKQLANYLKNNGYG